MIGWICSSALTMVGVLHGPPATCPAVDPPAAVASARAAMPWVEIHRRESMTGGRGADARWRLAARLGAALAWDLADLPGHQTGASQPWGAFHSPPGYAAPPVRARPSDVGGAIGALITRWNTLYPPYAVEATDDLERSSRQHQDPSQEPSCRAN